MLLDMSGWLLALFMEFTIAQLFLLPLLMSVLLINPRHFPLNWNLRIQKTLLLALFSLPLLLHDWSMPGNSSDATTINSTPQSTISADSAQGATSALSPSLLENDDFSLQPDDVFYFLSGLLIFASSLGLALFLLRLCYNQYFLYTLSLSASFKQQANFRIIRSSSLRSAFSIGMFKKRIFLPASIREGSEEETLIIEHEKNHFKCHHHYWALAEQLLRHVFWFNPFIHSFYHRGELLRELQCDLLTARSSDPIHYSKLLLNTAENAQQNTNKSLGSQLWLHKKTLKRRLHMLLNTPSFTKKLILIPGGALLLSLALIATVQWQNQDEYFEELALNHIHQQYQTSLSKYPAVEYSEVPQTLTQALLKHEDQDFFDHNGISLKATSRAMIRNASAWLSGKKRFVSGGSTITQQLAKSFLKEKRSLSRKMREAKLARIIESNFSKEDILEMYLNRVYFGNNAWGLASASATYFSKPYQKLTLSEAAMLIPFLEAPTKYNMIKNPQLASSRQLNLLRKLEQ